VCDAEIDADWAVNLRFPSHKPLFESRGLWSAFHEGDGTAFYFRTDFLGDAPYKYAWFNHNFTRGRVHLLKRYFDAEISVYPLEYPLDELLMIHRVSRGEGAEVHACGVLMPDGVGRLFVGHSGAGKSTTSRLWLAREGVCVLSDDRIVCEWKMESLACTGHRGTATPALRRKRPGQSTEFTCWNIAPLTGLLRWIQRVRPLNYSLEPSSHTIARPVCGTRSSFSKH